MEKNNRPDGRTGSEDAGQTQTPLAPQAKGVVGGISGVEAPEATGCDCKDCRPDDAALALKLALARTDVRRRSPEFTPGRAGNEITIYARDYDTIRDALAQQPAAETQPVVWMNPEGGTVGHATKKQFKDADGDNFLTPLYAHPPPSAPVGVEWLSELSDDELRIIFYADPKLVTRLKAALAQQPAAVDEVCRGTYCCPSCGRCDNCGKPVRECLAAGRPQR